MAKEFIVPGQIITGAGALTMAESTLAQFGRKAMIVTDKVMVELGNCAKVETALKNQGIAYSVYSEIAGEPTDIMIENGLKQYREEGCDFLIALGGGSPIDSMKAIGSLVKNGGNISGGRMPTPFSRARRTSPVVTFGWAASTTRTVCTRP